MTGLRAALALALTACGRAPDVTAEGRAAWQGAWSVRLEVAPGTAWTPRDRVRLEIDGTTARVIDGDAIHPVELVVHPCAIELRELQTDRSVALLATLQYVIVDGVLRAGRGTAGVRRGGRAVVCMPDEGGIFTVAADGTCDVRHGEVVAPAACAWLGGTLRVGTAASSAVVIPLGAAALVSDELQASVEAGTVVRAGR